jgi:putative PIN family toxin of toxin-antitoxin system
MRRVELRWPLAPEPATESAVADRALVLDTNVVLDLLVFSDPATALVRELLNAKTLRWITTAAMRQELARVLDYPKIAPRVAFYGLSAASVLAAFDAQAQIVPIAARIPATCRDADDQQFLNLAAAHSAILLSKDKAVLALRKRLLAYGAQVATALLSESL